MIGMYPALPVWTPDSQTAGKGQQLEALSVGLKLGLVVLTQFVNNPLDFQRTNFPPPPTPFPTKIVPYECKQGANNCLAISSWSLDHLPSVGAFWQEN